MRKLFCLIVGIVLILSMFTLSGCLKGKNKYTDYSFDYFDTVTNIIGYESDQAVFKENCVKIKEKLYEYHKLYTIYSRYDGINNITSINENAGKTALVVDEKIIDMLTFSKQMYELTSGNVNVAMGSVLSIWHDYREKGINHPEKAELPSLKDLKKANKFTDIDKLVIDKENNTVFLKNSEMSLDVGAVAKGYATEQTAIWMEENGITGYLLNVGGNIRIVGKREDGEKWKLGIENPDGGEENPYIEYLELENMSLVTSGSYQRFYTVDGNNYHHIIDPETLMPSDKFKLVSVLCESSAMADSLSTALFSMDYESGLKLISSLENTHAFWVTVDGEKLYSEGFKKYCNK